MNKDIMFSSVSDDWGTPQHFFNLLDQEFHFVLDACASEHNAKCLSYFTKEDDALLQRWDYGGYVFCNPPYGRIMNKFVEKAYIENQYGVPIVLLLPARTDVKWFHNYIYNQHEIRFIKGRLHFNDSKDPAPFPSMVVVMR